MTTLTDRAGATADVVSIASHKVADDATWRAVFDAGRDLRERQGVRQAEVFVDPADPDAVVTRFESLAALQAFATDPELADAMRQRGVILPRSITVGVKP